jgi:hypothetical protein
MAQGKPDIARAQQLAKTLLSTRVIDFVPSDKVPPVDEYRSSVPPSNLSEYFEDVSKYEPDFTAPSETKFDKVNIDMQTLTLRDHLADLFCHYCGISLGNLDQIREAQARYPEKIAALEAQSWRLYEHEKSAKKILDLLLAIDDLVAHGIPPKPNTLRDGIKLLETIPAQINEADAEYSQSACAATKLESGHYERRAVNILRNITIHHMNPSAYLIPDYITPEIREKAQHWFSETNYGRKRSLHREVLSEIVQLVMAHEPTITAENYEKEFKEKKEMAKGFGSEANFLIQLLIKLREISATLAISPDKTRQQGG